VTTVRQLVQGLADGDVGLDYVEGEFELRPWPQSRRALTEAQLHGVDDTGPPTDNSPDWIEIQPGLTEEARVVLRAAYDRAQ